MFTFRAASYKIAKIESKILESLAISYPMTNIKCFKLKKKKKFSSLAV